MANNTKSSKKRYRGSVTFEGKKYYVDGNSREEVQKNREKKRQELEAGALDPKRMTVREWSQEWLKTYKKGKVGDKQLYDIKKTMNKWLLDYIGAYQMSKVNNRHIQEVVDRLEGNSNSLIKKATDIIKSIFYKAFINGYIPRNPAADIILPKSAKEKTRRSLTTEERKLLIETADKFKGGIFYFIMLYSGLRPQEVAALKWKHIDFEGSVIHVRDMLKSDGTIADIDNADNGKTPSATRDVPLEEVLKDKLVKQLEVVPSGDEDYVVLRRDGKGHHTRNSMRKMWLAFRMEMHKKMGGETTKTIKTYKNHDTGDKYNRGVEEVINDLVAPDLVPYCLRHTYCTDLKAAGVPVDVAKDLMGHSSITITANIYSHAEEKSTAEAKRKKDALNRSRENN